MSNFVAAIDSFGSSRPSVCAFFNSAQQRITYGQLCRASDALARQLLSSHPSVGRSEPVVVYGHKSPSMLVAFLACAKSGHPYVPIDVSLPADRIAAIMGQLDNPLVIVTEGELPEAVRELASECLALPYERVEELCRACDDVQLPSDACVSGDDTFYVLFTSGSTGVPKGVEVSAANVDAFLAWMLDEYPPCEGEVFFDRAPFSFDLSVTDLVRGLGAGGTLFSLEQGSESNLKEAFTALAKSGVAFWVSTPSFADMCLVDPSFDRGMLPNLATFFFVGETLRNETARLLLERFPGCTVVNGYGPTESTVLITATPISLEMANSPEPLPVGMPKPNIELVILDPDTLRRLEPDEEGELFIVGDTVAKGYFNLPEATQAAFASYPYEVPAGMRAYRTGDRCFVDASGMLHFRGRLDFQVKLHGYRIELGDIESNLCLVDGVRQACVVYVDKGGANAYLRAFVQLDDPSAGSFQETRRLKAALRGLVPDYMVPRAFTFVESFPTNVNGKIDRAALLNAVSGA